MPPPRITLLIPCHNAAGHLPRLMAGVRAQTIPFDEVRVYDDGSTDHTAAVAAELGLEVIHCKTNLGVAAARNRLVSAATTEWIHFHDADDLIAPDFVERLRPHCQDSCDVVSCDADWLNEATRSPLIAWRYDAAELERQPFPYLIANPLGLNNSLIRRSAWQKIGGCNEALQIWEDADVHVRLAQAGSRFHHVPAVLTFSLRRPGSFSHDYPKNWNCRVHALEQYAASPAAAPIGALLASEAEKAAGNLASMGERAGAERAIALCRRLGRNPPTSRNPLLLLLKSCVPAYFLMRWQALHRQKARPRAATQPDPEACR